jgi:hypothetical protein
MAYGNPGNPGPKEDLYGDGPEEQPMEKKGGEGEDEEYPTAVLPKSILMGKEFKPGDEVVLRITEMHDDQVVVTYAPAEKEEGSKEKDEAEGEGEMAPTAGGGEAGGGGGGYSSMME